MTERESPYNKTYGKPADPDKPVNKKRQSTARLINQRGAGHERDTCRKLSLWLSEGKEDGWFWRSAMSGGRATLFGAAAAQQAGDVSGLAPRAHEFLKHYAVECKRRRDLQLRRTLLGLGSELRTLFVEAQTEARKFGRDTWLIAKEDRLPTLLCVNATLLKHSVFRQQSRCVLLTDKLSFVVYDFERFLERTKPSDILGD